MYQQLKQIQTLTSDISIKIKDVNTYEDALDVINQCGFVFTNHPFVVQLAVTLQKRILVTDQNAFDMQLWSEYLKISALNNDTLNNLSAIEKPNIEPLSTATETAM